MAVSVPSWVPADWRAGAKAGSAVLIGAGAIAVSNGLIKSIFEYRAKRTNPMTYVLNVKKRVKASAEANRINVFGLVAGTERRRWVEAQAPAVAPYGEKALILQAPAA